MKLLLQDQHAMFLDGLAVSLVLQGHQVVVSSRTWEGLEHEAAREQPDVCVVASSGSVEPLRSRLARLRQAVPTAPVVLLATDLCPEVWRAWDEGCVTALVARSAPLAELQLVVEGARLGTRRVVGVVRCPQEAAVGRGPRRGPVVLTTRELEVLELMAEGLSNAQLAGQLDVTLNTVRTHVQAVLHKLDAPRRGRAVTRAQELGLLEQAPLAGAW